MKDIIRKFRWRALTGSLVLAAVFFLLAVVVGYLCSQAWPHFRPVQSGGALSALELSDAVRLPIDASMTETEWLAASNQKTFLYFVTLKDGTPVNVVLGKEQHEALTKNVAVLFAGELAQGEAVHLQIEEMIFAFQDEDPAFAQMLERYAIAPVIMPVSYRVFVFLLVVLAALLTICVYHVVKLWRIATRTTMLDKDVARLARWKHCSIGSCMQRVQAELCDENKQLFVGKNAICSEHYLIMYSNRGARLIELSEIIWMFHRAHTTRYYGIPVSRDYSVELFLRDKKREGVRAGKGNRKEESEALIGTLAKRLPHVFIGYSKKLEEKWKKTPEQMVYDIDQRIGMGMAEAVVCLRQC